MAYDFRKWAANDRRQRVRRRSTRWLLVFGLVVAVGFAVAQVLLPHDPGRMVVGNPGLYMPLILGASLSPFARETWFTSRGLAAFDEFERDAMRRAMANGYRTLLILVALVFGWLWLAAASGWPLPRTAYDWSAVGIALTLTGAALPVLFAEFTVPMPPAGDELEDEA